MLLFVLSFASRPYLPLTFTAIPRHRAASSKSAPSLWPAGHVEHAVPRASPATPAVLAPGRAGGLLGSSDTWPMRRHGRLPVDSGNDPDRNCCYGRSLEARTRRQNQVPGEFVVPEKVASPGDCKALTGYALQTLAPRPGLESGLRADPTSLDSRRLAEYRSRSVLHVDRESDAGDGQLGSRKPPKDSNTQSESAGCI